MATSAPIFYADVAYFITLVVSLASLIVQAVALIHCVTQRGDGFQAIGTLPKGAWLAILAICFVLTFFSVTNGGNAIGIIGLIGVAAALIYLLDVRRGLRDLTDGKGFW